jgi:hypothetical protein
VEWLAPVLEGLGNASGWVVALVVLGLVAYGFWKGYIVPGYVYERERARGDRAEDAVDASNRTVDSAAAATKAATEAAVTVAELHHPDDAGH